MISVKVLNVYRESITQCISPQLHLTADITNNFIQSKLCLFTKDSKIARHPHTNLRNYDD